MAEGEDKKSGQKKNSEPDKTQNIQLPDLTKTSVVDSKVAVISFDQTVNTSESDSSNGNQAKKESSFQISKNNSQTFSIDKSFNFGPASKSGNQIPTINPPQPVETAQAYEHVFDPDESIRTAEIELEGSPGKGKLKKPISRFHYDGLGSELLDIILTSLILSIFTAGIYSFWAKVRIRKYNWSHFYVQKQRFEYTGTGLELLIAMIKLLILAAFVGILSVGTAYLLPNFAFYLYGGTSLVGIFLYGYIQFSVRRYSLRRTLWNGFNFDMNSSPIKYALFYFLWTISLPISLGLTAPFRWVYLRKILTENTRIGALHFTYKNRIKKIWLAYYFSFIFTILTLGFYYPWHKARLMRWDFSSTRLGSAKLKCIITGGDILSTFILCLLITLFTAGLGYPRAIIYWQEMMADAMAITGDVPFDQIEKINE